MLCCCLKLKVSMSIISTWNRRTCLKVHAVYPCWWYMAGLVPFMNSTASCPSSRHRRTQQTLPLRWSVPLFLATAFLRHHIKKVCELSTSQNDQRMILSCKNRACFCPTSLRFRLGVCSTNVPQADEETWFQPVLRSRRRLGLDHHY